MGGGGHYYFPYRVAHYHKTFHRRWDTGINQRKGLFLAPLSSGVVVVIIIIAANTWCIAECFHILFTHLLFCVVGTIIPFYRREDWAQRGLVIHPPSGSQYGS